MNILFSTTRQWNPGDEFILFGIVNLLKELRLDFNPVIYNRNPEVLQAASALNPLRRFTRYWKGEWLWGSFIRKGFYDNSFKLHMDGDFVDLVVFAGTPAWYSRQLKPLYDLIERKNLPVIYLGIGGLDADPARVILDPAVVNALKGAAAVIVRDENAFRALNEYRPELLPCPALYASAKEKTIVSVKKVALIHSCCTSAFNHSKLTDKNQEILVLAYKRLLAHYRGQLDFEFVVHYIDDLEDANRIFGKDVPVRYSYDARDYIDVYQQFDLVIGPRVHGIGLAASCGVPGIHFAHDALRSPAANGFKAVCLSPEQFSEFDALTREIDAICVDVGAANQRLIAHKKETKAALLKLLKERIGGNFPIGG